MALSGDYWEVKYCSSLAWDEEKLSEFGLSTQLWQEHVHMVLILENISPLLNKLPLLWFCTNCSDGCCATASEIRLVTCYIIVGLYT